MKPPLRTQKAGAVTARSGSLERMVSRYSRLAWTLALCWSAAWLVVAVEHWDVPYGVPLEEDYRLRTESTIWVSVSFAMMALSIAFVGVCLNAGRHPDCNALEGKTDAN